jgi:methionyl-tRNA synthetase
MFLPDRYIKGTCPKCGTKDQYGDNVRKLRSGLRAPDRPDRPVFRPCRARTPVLQKLGAPFSSSMSAPERCVDFLEKWTQGNDEPSPGKPRLQPEVCSTRSSEWLQRTHQRRVRTARQSEGLGDWDISRDAPYFGIEIPDAAGQVLLCLAGCARWATSRALKAHLLDKRCIEAGEDGLSYSEYMADPALEQIPLHRQGHRLPSTRCSGRPCCISAAARHPTIFLCMAFSP